MYGKLLPCSVCSIVRREGGVRRVDFCTRRKKADMKVGRSFWRSNMNYSVTKGSLLAIFNKEMQLNTELFPKK